MSGSSESRPKGQIVTAGPESSDQLADPLRPTTVETQVLLPNGTSRSICLKCWPHGSELRWEPRRLLLAAGYRYDSHRTKVCNVFTSQQAMWDITLGWLLMPGLGHSFGQSSHSSRARSVEVSADSAEEEYWVSAQWMLGLLLQWQHRRRDVQKREEVRVLAETVFQILCPRNRWPEGWFGHLPEPTTAETELCKHLDLDLMAERPECACMQELRQMLGTLQIADDATPHAQMWGRLAAGFEFSHCPTVGALTGRMLKDVSDRIGACFSDWANVDFLKSTGLVLLGPSNKKRRLDPHFKEAAIQSVLQEGQSDKARNFSKAMKVVDEKTTFRWIESALLQLSAAARVTFHQIGVCSIALDGARMGKPAHDWLFIAQSMGSKHLVMPPQDMILV
ncbi:unnamed protein product [Symbiodinium sp. CCMP2592]|nr:unnamed protein product [Symbiodinium sp. CCMP2592]